ncbi:MAG: DNA topoisomerase IB [Gammaproteobacteria bacterium]
MPTVVDSESAPGRLRYVSDRRPGYTRENVRGGMRYVEATGAVVRDAEILARIARLAIPPAWTDVWICADPQGHLQATGRDTRGRKQYRYHPAWRARRERDKFGALRDFGRALPTLRRRVEADLALPGLSDTKVVAAAVRLLDLTLMRIGNTEYARLNGSFGLTTLRNRHVRVAGEQVLFSFRGKGGRAQRLGVIDRRLARIVARCRELPGQELFQYLDAEGRQRPIDSGAVNAYLATVAGEGCTAKSFRTWGASLLAARLFARQSAEQAAGAPRQGLRPVLEAVAAALGNTPAICRKSYVHPALIDAYQSGAWPDVLARCASDDRLTAERALLAFLNGGKRARRRSPGT